jgi:hypothetical protein
MYETISLSIGQALLIVCVPMILSLLAAPWLNQRRASSQAGEPCPHLARLASARARYNESNRCLQRAAYAKDMPPAKWHELDEYAAFTDAESDVFEAAHDVVYAHAEV